MNNLKTGIVVKVFGTVYYVEHEKEVYSCKLRGKMKLLQNKNERTDPRINEKMKILRAKNTKNPIVVGDIVNFLPMESEELGEDGYKQGFVHSITDRKNKLSRSFTQSRKKPKEHLLASNIDYVLCVNSVKEPRLNTAFIDRILVTCEKENITPIIIINKIDLDNQTVSETEANIFSKEESEIFITNENIIRVESSVRELYEPLGYSVYGISAREKSGMDKLKDVLKNKTVVLTGYSGVGKSTIINSILGQNVLRVSEVSSFNKKGRHTTTTAELIETNLDGYIIDTPGLREFGIYNIDKNDLYHYYREMGQYASECKYSPCTHSHEPDCAVKQAVNNGKINEIRYRNYLKILDTLPVN